MRDGSQTDTQGQPARIATSVSVLVVDDDPQATRLMLEVLARMGIGATVAGDSKAVTHFFETNSYDLVLLSRTAVRKGTAGSTHGHFELLKDIKANCPELPVVLIAEPSGSCSDTSADRLSGKQLFRCGARAAVSAMSAGFSDVLVKPLSGPDIENVLSALLPSRPVSNAANAQEGSHCLYQIVGKSPKLLQSIELAERIAPTAVPVVIAGESGTGKELVSYLVHHKSKRNLGPYIRVNCAALSESLLESELFGHEKGAFTGAYTRRKGRFELAHGGTLLLDEITETPPRFQAKLLRILEQQEFERVGGNDNVRVDVRVISTTNRDLALEVQAGRFRQDLYYRLSAARIMLAPLRERPDDLPDLVWHFVNLYARQVHRKITQLDPPMMKIFAKCQWPGNVRQLRNVVLTSLILGMGPTLSLADVSWLFDELQPLPQCNGDHLYTPATVTAAGQPQKLDRVGGIPLAQLERQAILETLKQTAGNRTKAAKVLGISDRTLRDKVKRYKKAQCLQSSNMTAR